MKYLFFVCLLCLSFQSFAQTTEKPEKSKVDAEFDRAFMPGGGYALFLPKGKDSLGILRGGTIEFLLFTHVAQNDDSGPSHIRIYGKLNMLNSDKKNVTNFFSYAAGLDMSLERNPKRNYFIPYFGLEMGGLSNKSFGTTLQFTPTLGMHVVSRQNLFINLQAGYMYPVKNFDLLQGYAFQASLNFSFW